MSIREQLAAFRPGATAADAGLELTDPSATPRGWCPGCKCPRRQAHQVTDSEGRIRHVCRHCCPRCSSV